MTTLQQFKKELPEIVRIHRKKTALSQAALAQIAGVGKTVIFDLEHGKMTIQLDTLLRILGALNIEMKLYSPLLQAMKETQQS